MPSVEFEVWCSCGEGLCNQTKDVRGGIQVEPCANCLDKAMDAGYDKGYSEGYEEGQKLIKEN